MIASPSSGPSSPGGESLIALAWACLAASYCLRSLRALPALPHREGSWGHCFRAVSVHCSPSCVRPWLRSNDPKFRQPSISSGFAARALRYNRSAFAKFPLWWLSHAFWKLSAPARVASLLSWKPDVRRCCLPKPLVPLPPCSHGDGTMCVG